MARPEKDRKVYEPPAFKCFKPAGVRKGMLETVILTLDEYEALRLADYHGLEHSEAAEKMSISRPTFTRLVSRARKKLSDMLINGKVLQIEGGAVHFAQNKIKCLACGNIFQDSLDQNEYICPDCGSRLFEDMAKGFGHGRCCGKKFK
jgi:predicted DNA-binding protein (UPF0251 family)